MKNELIRPTPPTGRSQSKVEPTTYSSKCTPHVSPANPSNFPQKQTVTIQTYKSHNLFLLLKRKNDLGATIFCRKTSGVHERHGAMEPFGTVDS